MLWFDPMYFVFLAPALLLGIWAQVKVKSAYAKAQEVAAGGGLSGAEAAYRILQSNGLDHVAVEPTNGFLSDHYDPRHKVLRLSPDVYQGRSLAAVGIAAHEAGHAIQDRVGYAPLKLRNGIVPLASIGSGMGMFVLMFGLILGSLNLLLVGIVLYSGVVAFQLINLPVEFNASRRAREVLVKYGIVSQDELPVVGRVLNAAALTYVAATLSAILTLLYFLFRFGLLGGARDE